MNTCKTCKWWEKKDASRVREEFVGMGCCNNPLLCVDGEDMPSMNGLSAGEALYSPCQPDTGPDFGCIHHEQKE